MKKCSSTVPVVKQNFWTTFNLRGPQNYVLALLLTACNGPQEPPEFSPPESLPDIQVADDLPESVPFGEPIDVRLRFTAEERLALPAIEEWLTPPVELLNQSSTETLTEETWQRDVELSVAVYAVTNLTLFVDQPLLENPDLTLPFASLEVTTRLDSDEPPLPKFGSDELPDFRGSEALRRQKRNLWIGLGVALTLILVALIALWKFLHRVIPPPPPVPAHRTAFDSLNKLEQDSIWTTPNVDASAVALSLILRTYIEERFGIQAPDLTTEEFLLSVEEQAPWSDEKQDGLKRFFTATDRIKFAGDRPQKEVLDELMESVKEFVNSTKQEVTT